MKPIFIGKDDSIAKEWMHILASHTNNISSLITPIENKNMKQIDKIYADTAMMGLLSKVSNPDLITENGLFDLKTTNDQYYRKRKHISLSSMSANLRRYYTENNAGCTSTKAQKKKKSKRNKISKKSRKNNR